MKFSRHLQLTVKDDGQGLNLGKLRSLLSEKGIETQGEKDIANHIFDENLSTAKDITEFSGRGMGMAAVKSFLEDCGCTIEVILGNRLSDGFRELAFVIEVSNFHTVSLIDFRRVR